MQANNVVHIWDNIWYFRYIQILYVVQKTGFHSFVTCDMWRCHFYDILNSSKDNSRQQLVRNSFRSMQGDTDMFTVSDVKAAIRELRTGVSAGMDGLASEHYKFANDRVYVLLSVLVNSFIVHGHIPERVMDSLIIPLLKDNKGNICDKNNYRPIAITCISSKIVEIMLLHRYRNVFYTSCNQFSFKAKHSTDMCTFVLKETIDYYVSCSSPIYLCFVDASKAFDRINYWHMFEKLLSRGLPPVIVRLLMYWYMKQNFIIKWCDKLSTPFNGTNGLRQGGILSPILFNVFMDDPSQELSNTNVGCYHNNVCINHLFYADDSVLLASSPAALQLLLKVCEMYANKYEMVYNAKKTACMVVYPKVIKNMSPPLMLLGGKALKWIDEHKYLGVFISSSNCDDKDIRRQIQSTYCRGNVLINKFRNCDNSVKVQLFKTYCCNFYCCQLWASYSKSIYNKMCVAYNNVFRALFKLDRRCRVSQNFLDKNIDCFNILMRKAIYSFRSRLYRSNNSLVQACLSSQFFIYTSKIAGKWFELLY